MAIERLIGGRLSQQLQEIISAEELVLDAFRDLIKDELKRRVHTAIENDETLREEVDEAMNYYFQAKARSMFAEIKASRAAARLGMAILPEETKNEASEALVGLFERELTNLLERAL
ncbi:MAG TPA: hypothetical protein QF646_03000 [Candidatus Poseidoniales archaeon]|nr:hypothetical protein [Candidatus Poseidoniales archaeon]